MSYKDRLSKLSQQWDKSKPTAGFEKLPAGKYQFEIKRATLGESTASYNKGHLQVTYEVAVAIGPLKGKKAFINVDLESDGKNGQYPTGMSIFKGHLTNLGVEIPKQLTEKAIQEVLKTLIGVIFNGQCVVNGKGYANIYINDAVSAAASSDDDEDDEDEDDDDESDEAEDDEESDTEETTTEETDEEDDDSEEDEDDEDDEEEPAPPPKKPAVVAKPATTTVTKKPAVVQTAPAKLPPAKPAVKKPEPKPEAPAEDDWDSEFENA